MTRIPPAPGPGPPYRGFGIPVSAGFAPWRVRPHRVRPHIYSSSDQVPQIYLSRTEKKDILCAR